MAKQFTFCRARPAARLERLKATAAIALVVDIRSLPEAPALLLSDRVHLRSHPLRLCILCLHHVDIVAAAASASHLCG